MATSFKLQVITPARTVFDGEIESLTAPGKDGYVGVLAHHAPLVSTLGAGKLTIVKGGEESVYQVDGGFLEVHGNVATLLVDRLES